MMRNVMPEAKHLLNPEQYETRHVTYQKLNLEPDAQQDDSDKAAAILTAPSGPKGTFQSAPSTRDHQFMPCGLSVGVKTAELGYMSTPGPFSSLAFHTRSARVLYRGFSKAGEFCIGNFMGPDLKGLEANFSYRAFFAVNTRLAHIKTTTF